VANADVPVLYYAFDLLYLDGYDWRRVPLEERKRKLASSLVTGDVVRYSDHYEEHGKALFEMAQKKGLEGIVAKKRASFYEERRSREWLKIKIRHPWSAWSEATPSPKAAARILDRWCWDSTTRRGG
jgi:ATP-dependent DNA ligase